MTNNVFLLFLACALISAATAGSVGARPRGLRFRSLERGHLGPKASPGVTLITNLENVPENIDKHWRRHSALWKKVDFKKEALIFVSLGWKNEGVHLVKVTRVRRQGKGLLVTLRPSLDQLMSDQYRGAYMSHFPYDFVAIPRHGLKEGAKISVRFDWSDVPPPNDPRYDPASFGGTQPE